MTSYPLLVCGLFAIGALLDTTASRAQQAPATAPSPAAVLRPAPPPAGMLALPTTSLELNDKVSMQFVQIPAGKFLMGSAPSELGHDKDEAPCHEVTITQPFFMGIYPVTLEQYQAVMGNNGGAVPPTNHPVTLLSWDDAVAFGEKLSTQTHKKVHLPTEAQWEYAARAGTLTRYYFGGIENQLPNYAWYSANSLGTTHPVGLKKPNPWGLYDMCGNVFQYCADWYGPYTAGKLSDPPGAATGTDRVLRGGCWSFGPQYCRSASRSWVNPTTRIYATVGFRVVLEAE